jgi:hypothetical protein
MTHDLAEVLCDVAAERAEMEGKNADWFLGYRDGVFKELLVLECQKNQYKSSGRKCGFTDGP